MSKPTTTTPLRAALALVCFAAGCETAGNICGKGLRPSVEHGKCVPMDAGSRSGREDEQRREMADSNRDDSAPSKPPSPDSGDSQDAGDSKDAGPTPLPDASKPALDAASPDAADDAAMDAGADAAPDDAVDTGMPEAAAGDADVAADDATAPADDAHVSMGDAETDAALQEAGTPEGDAGPVCTPDDTLAWRQFHLSASLLGTIDTCASQPGCALGVCPMVQCLQDGAGLSTCDDCVAQEVECVFEACFDECSNDSSDAACLACACDAGCPALFAQCSGEPLEVCDACAPAILYCKGMHPWPALFVPIMH